VSEITITSARAECADCGHTHTLPRRLTFEGTTARSSPTQPRATGTRAYAIMLAEKLNPSAELVIEE
jgi:hypothetical protein